MTYLQTCSYCKKTPNVNGALYLPSLELVYSTPASHTHVVCHLYRFMLPMRVGSGGSGGRLVPSGSPMFLILTIQMPKNQAFDPLEIKHKAPLTHWKNLGDAFDASYYRKMTMLSDNASSFICIQISTCEYWIGIIVCIYRTVWLCHQNAPSTRCFLCSLLSNCTSVQHIKRCFLIWQRAIKIFTLVSCSLLSIMKG